MASSTLLVKGRTMADCVPAGGTTLSLASQSPTGAYYVDPAGTLKLPFKVTFDFKIGTPGSLGADKLTVLIQNAAEDATTKVVNVLSAKLEITVPRVGPAWSSNSVQDILAQVASICGVSATRVAISEALVP